MKILILLSTIFFSTLSFANEIHPYGDFIQNKKTKEKIVAQCNWLWDDKTQGKLICIDLRLYLVDKKFNEIRELTKIKSLDQSRNVNLPGTDEYIRTPEDFKGNMVKKMLNQDFAGTKIQQIKQKVEDTLEKISLSQIGNFSIHRFFISYLKNLPTILVLYPYGLLLEGADTMHTKVLYPAKIKHKSVRFYHSLVKTITRKEKQKISLKNSDFKFALEVLER